MKIKFTVHGGTKIRFFFSFVSFVGLVKFFYILFLLFLLFPVVLYIYL